MHRIHFLKIWPIYFEAVVDGRKSFEIRQNDRGFQVGDDILLQEWSPEYESYIGREVRVVITYLLDFPAGLRDGFVCMSISKLEASSMPDNQQLDLDLKPRPVVSEDEVEREPQKVLRSGRCSITTTQKGLDRILAGKKKQSKKEKLESLKRWVQRKARVSGDIQPGEWDKGTEALYDRLQERVH